MEKPTLAKMIDDIMYLRSWVNGMEEEFCRKVGQVTFEYRQMCDEVMRELILKEREYQDAYDKETGSRS